MDQYAKIYVAGHRGLVGSALIRYLAAAKVGGILANNTYPAEFIHQNLAIQTNVIHES